jgi:hypothetical protein
LWRAIEQETFLCVDVKLKQMDSYLLVSVGQEAKLVEYYDYSKRLCDLKLFYTFFKIIEIEGDLQEKTFNSDLSKCWLKKVKQLFYLRPS